MMENKVRLINANEIPWCNYDLDNYHSFVGVEKEYVDDMPTVDPESLRPNGRWVYDDGNLEWTCSECLSVAHIGLGTKYAYILSDYCPNCGVKMGD